MHYVTTNVRFDAVSYRQLKLRAAEQRKSLAQLVREAVIRVYQTAEPSRTRGRQPRDPFFRIVGMCATGMTDGAAHHDRDIYGVKA